MYANAKIEDPRDGTIYNIGDELPDDLPGLDELAAHDSALEQPPAIEGPPGPQVVAVITDGQADGLTKSTREELERKGLLTRHVTAGDAGEGGDQSR